MYQPKSRKRTLTKERILARIDKIKPEKVYGLSALATHAQLNVAVLLRLAGEKGFLLDHPTLTHNGQPCKAIKGGDAAPILRGMVKSVRKGWSKKRRSSKGTQSRKIKGFGGLRNTNKIEPDRIYGIRQVSHLLNVGHTLLRGEADKRGFVINHPTLSHQGHPCLAIKGSDLLTLIRDKSGAPPKREAPAPAPASFDFSKGIEVYTRLEKDLTQYPPELASAVVAALAKKFSVV